MFFVLGLFVSFVAALAAFVISRKFVETRLRYVDAVQRPYAALLAGAAAALIAIPFTFLPFVGIGTALLFGFGVFAGVASGAREIRRRIGA